MSQELSIIPDSKELVRQSTDIAHLCKEIVVASAVIIQDRKYVRVEGWQAIATAHGCAASARDVRKVEGGMVATGEIRRMQDGQLIATAEGFVGEDEPTWYGGEVEKEEWTGSKGQRRKTGKTIKTTLPKRAEYAIRAMAQTRAISRACRGCFAHVVVLMNAGLSTTPAEEVPEGGFSDSHHSEPSDAPKAEQPPEDRKPKALASFDGFFQKEGCNKTLFVRTMSAGYNIDPIKSLEELTIEELERAWNDRKKIVAQMKADDAREAA